jgi:transposase
MLPPRTALSAEQVRRLAVSMFLDGDPPDVVAETLGVSERSVWRWAARWRGRGRAGDAALATRPGRGRPPKLTARQAGQVLRWVERSPCAFGFATERWTAPRLAAVVAERLGVRLNHRYLNDWLRRRGVTPQVPPRVPRERDDAAVAAWVADVWPGIKKRRPTAGRRWRSRTRAGS